MVDRILVGLAFSIAVIVWLAWVRHYRWQNLAMAGGGWTAYFLILAVLAESPSGREPLVFMIGCLVGAVIERGFRAEQGRRKSQDQGRPSVTKVTEST